MIAKLNASKSRFFQRQNGNILTSPFLVGTAAAFFMIQFIWQWGRDARLFYLRLPPPNAPVPMWVYFITTPFSFLGWPLSMQVWLALTIFVIALAYVVRGERNWWVAAFSAPMLYNAWLGQIELLPVLGLVLGLLLVQGKLANGWIGAMWLLMAAKPQVTWGLILIVTFWFVKDRGWRALIPGSLLSLGIIALTFLIWPGWPEGWISTMKTTGSGMANASIFPYGMLALPFAYLPRALSRYQRMRLVAAATLLFSPYFTLYHCLTLLVMYNRPWVLLLSWAPIVMIFKTRDWGSYSAVIPITLIILELVAIKRNRAAFS